MAESQTSQKHSKRHDSTSRLQRSSAQVLCMLATLHIPNHSFSSRALEGTHPYQIWNLLWKKFAVWAVAPS
jgi:hypothetical protein